jgi:hypothetical protein
MPSIAEQQRKRRYAERHREKLNARARERLRKVRQKKQAAHVARRWVTGATTTTPRKCLSCDKLFPSEWVGNRMCDSCKQRDIAHSSQPAFADWVTPMEF